MASGIGYYKCSLELYTKYLEAGRIVDTDFYFVEDSVTGTSKLYLGKILLSNVDHLESALEDPTIEVVFDGGDADTNLAILDTTILE